MTCTPYSQAPLTLLKLATEQAQAPKPQVDPAMELGLRLYNEAQSGADAETLVKRHLSPETPIGKAVQGAGRSYVRSLGIVGGLGGALIGGAGTYTLLKLLNANLSRGGMAAASLAGAAVGGGLGYTALPVYTMGTTGYHILKGLKDVSAAIPEHVKWMQENPPVAAAKQP